MFIVILFIFLGIGIGYAVRTRSTSAPLISAVNKWSGKATTWLIWLLLFMLGLEVGSDKHIIASLPTLGVEALLLSVCATVGSCVLAWALWKTAKKGGAEQ